MFIDKYVFAQLVSFLNRNKFNRIVAKRKGDKYIKHFSCWNQLLVLMFGQLANRESLRDLIIAVNAHKSKLYHLGFGKNVAKSTLASSNQDRDYRIFEEYAFYLINEAQKLHTNDMFNLGGNIYAFDSTTIDLCISLFWWAKFRKTKAGLKIHTLFDVATRIPKYFLITEAVVHDSKAMDSIPYESDAYYIFDRGYNDFARLYNIHKIGSNFVIRAKKNVKYTTLKWRRTLPENVISDLTIEFSGSASKNKYPEKLRLVKFYDAEKSREFIFLTNNFKISSLQIAELYKNRWQVELFFKWIKQHLKIKKFWGTTENAVRIQIYTAICTYCLVAIVQKKLELNRSIYEILQILNISLTDKINLKNLLEFSPSVSPTDIDTDLFNFWEP